MKYIIKGFKPKKLFEHFEELSSIPRCSGNESAAADFLVEFAKEHHLNYYRDKLHNIIIKKPSSIGCNSFPPIMLQGHTDMVCEKSSVSHHDFSKDGLSLFMDNGILRAKDTTLGADDGIAVAIMMTILENNDFPHPPLECVFTSQEETGFTGASHLDTSLISARTLINLDSEEEGIATVSCAGGARITLTKKYNSEQYEYPAAEISICGLRGGHSGTDISLERGNSIKLMGRILSSINEKISIRLCTINGGGKDNAIPRECNATVAFTSNQEFDLAIPIIRKQAKEIYRELSATEPDFCVNIEPCHTNRIIDNESANKILKLLCLAPNGLKRRNINAGGFTVCSLNLGIIETTADKISATFLLRSSVSSLQVQTKRELTTLADLLGFDVSITSEYPGWSYKEHSPIRDICSSCFKELTNKTLRCEAIHAGLECGLFSEKLTGLDAVAIGPSITGCHTPNEALDLASCEKVYMLVKEMLIRLTK